MIYHEQCLYVSDSLSVISEDDAVYAQLAGSLHCFFEIIQKDHLGRLDTETLAGQFEDARVRLLYPYLMGVNDEVAYIAEAVVLLFFFTSTNEAVAYDSSLITRAQCGEVGCKLNVKRAEVLIPEIIHKFIELSLVQPQNLACALFYFLLCYFAYVTV